MLFRAGWSPSTTYNQGDIAAYNDKLWQANRTGVTSVPDAQTNDWTLLAGERITQAFLNQAPLFNLHPGYIAGKQYTMCEAPTTNSAIAAVDTLYFTPFRVFAPLLFTGAAVRVSAGGAASSIKSGIWANDPANGRPVGVPLFSDNSGPATTGTGQIAIPMAGFLMPGFYWFGTKFTGTLPSLTSGSAIAFLMPNGGTLSTVSLSFADAYANNIAQTNLPVGSTFISSATPVPALQLNT